MPDPTCHPNCETHGKSRAEGVGCDGYTNEERAQANLPTPLDLTRLRTLAEDADTGTPWVATSDTTYDHLNGNTEIWYLDTAGADDEHATKFSEAFDPTTALALLDHIEALQRRIVDLEYSL